MRFLRLCRWFDSTGQGGLCAVILQQLSDGSGWRSRFPAILDMWSIRIRSSPNSGGWIRGGRLVRRSARDSLLLSFVALYGDSKGRVLTCWKKARPRILSRKWRGEPGLRLERLVHSCFLGHTLLRGQNSPRFVAGHHYVTHITDSAHVLHTLVRRRIAASQLAHAALHLLD